MNINELVDKSRLRNEFTVSTGGRYSVPIKFLFSEAEMKIEAKVDAKTFWVVYGILFGVIILGANGFGLVLSIAESDWTYLMITAIVPAVIIPPGILFLVFATRAKMKLDSEGAVSSELSGLVRRRLWWSEIESVSISKLAFIGVKFSKKGRGNVVIPVTPEVLYVVAHYYPQINEILPQFAPYLMQHHRWQYR